MTNDSPKNTKWPLWASIIAVVLAVLSLCAGWFVPYASLLCPLAGFVLALLGLKSRNKALPIIALVLSILSFCILASLGLLIWTRSPQEISDMDKSLGGLFTSLGNLFQSIILYLKAVLKIP